MESFVGRHVEQIIGVVSGFDRLVFRGALRALSYVGGMMMYLGLVGVLLKDFAEHALSMTKKTWTLRKIDPFVLKIDDPCCAQNIIISSDNIRGA